LVGFGAGLVGVAEVSFHVLVAGDFEGKGGGVFEAFAQRVSKSGRNDRNQSHVAVK